MNPQSESDSAVADKSAPSAKDDMLQFAQLGAEMGSDLAGLLVLEARLAVSSLQRMLLIAVASLPLMLLAWVSLTLVPAILAYRYTGIIEFALLAFLACQILALLVIKRLWSRYLGTLTLPMSREQLRRLWGTFA